MQLCIVLAVLLSGLLLPTDPGRRWAVRLIVHSPAHPHIYTYPDGGRTLFPEYRLVALYGTPGAPALGALGQQPLPDTIARAKALAAQYQPLIHEHTLPTLEIIATVASSSPMPDNSYSTPVPLRTLSAWIVAAKQSGVYVVLDLQPGRSDFLSQAKQLKPLLEQPNVGLALDPEWRLTPSEVPLVQIGTVNITEVNQVVEWLAALTQQYKLPQKLLVLQEFRPSMIQSRNLLDTSHADLAYVIQMDGQGTQDVKLSTWAAVTADPPPNAYFGWKNFYVKDSPLRSPQDTMTLSPTPWYISYE
jgi:hypothetical protein